jgi:hypothetical protein
MKLPQEPEEEKGCFIMSVVTVDESAFIYWIGLTE